MGRGIVTDKLAWANRAALLHPLTSAFDPKRTYARCTWYFGGVSLGAWMSWSTNPWGGHLRHLIRCQFPLARAINSILVLIACTVRSTDLRQTAAFPSSTR